MKRGRIQRIVQRSVTTRQKLASTDADKFKHIECADNAYALKRRLVFTLLSPEAKGSFCRDTEAPVNLILARSRIFAVMISSVIMLVSTLPDVSQSLSVPPCTSPSIHSLWSNPFDLQCFWEVHALFAGGRDRHKKMSRRLDLPLGEMRP